MKKQLIIMMLVVAMLLSLTACGSTNSNSSQQTNNSDTTENSEPSSSNEEGKVKYTVGICQLVRHDALDAATQGFIDALEEALGETVSIEKQNASNDIPTCSTICNGFAANNVDLIMANATPALQAAVSATQTIPILGTSVTEYGVALDLENFDGVVGGNVSGTSDLAPLDQQAQMITELVPDAKVVGILYCSAEANSVYQANVVKKCLEDENLTVNIYTFADSNDVSTVTATACDDCDVLYIPTDNTAASCTEAINNVAEQAGTPIIAGEEGICKGCGIATLSISYYDIGYTTGQMAVKILTGEADISTMPIEYYQNPVKKYNPVLCEALNISVPDDYEAIAD